MGSPLYPGLSPPTPVHPSRSGAIQTGPHFLLLIQQMRKIRPKWRQELGILCCDLDGSDPDFFFFRGGNRLRELKQFPKTTLLRGYRAGTGITRAHTAVLSPAGTTRQLKPCWLSSSHLVGDLARIVLDGKLRQRHLGFGVEGVGAVVVVALLEEGVVCGL